MNNENKIIIYQVFTRLFGNNNNHCVYNGDIVTNGCGKMADFTLKALSEIKKLGTTHIWYTGIIEHATQTDYRRYNISPDHPAIVKGKAGSPYAIKDYYDVDPDLANDIPERMREFENLVRRTHRAGLKVIIDFVPNHVDANTILMHNRTGQRNWELTMIQASLSVPIIISIIFLKRNFVPSLT